MMGHYWGMHVFWWILWVGVLVWIFILPWDIPGQRKSKRSAMEILDRRFAAGEIDEDEYQRKKELLE